MSQHTETFAGFDVTIDERSAWSGSANRVYLSQYDAISDTFGNTLAKKHPPDHGEPSVRDMIEMVERCPERFEIILAFVRWKTSPPVKVAA